MSTLVSYLITVVMAIFSPQAATHKEIKETQTNLREHTLKLKTAKDNKPITYCKSNYLLNKDDIEKIKIIK